MLSQKVKISKWITLRIVAILCLGFSGCFGGGDDNNSGFGFFPGPTTSTPDQDIPGISVFQSVGIFLYST